VKSRYAVIAPESFVASNLPGWKNSEVVVNISPAMLGPRFTQLHITLSADGEGAGNTGAHQYFIYVIEGTGSILLQDKRHRLEVGSYIYLPAETDLQIKGSGSTMKLLIFQKPYEPLKVARAPGTIIGHERDVKSQPFFGNDATRMQLLLPDRPEFDMAVNIFTCQPGASLPSVLTHVMECGLLMLRGQGIYRLDDENHSVKTGDVIWIGSYCPHWFATSGNEPASYIYFKDVNRDPM
jgi:(S)-ureidoglycine aminohydrolase